MGLCAFYLIAFGLAEDFYKNDYPDEDYSSDFENAPDDDAGEEDSDWRLRQQLDQDFEVDNAYGNRANEYLYDENDYRDTYIGRTISDSDDDAGYDTSSRKNYHERSHTSEDEDMEHYRDRIFGELQQQIEKRKNLTNQLRQQK